MGLERAAHRRSPVPEDVPLEREARAEGVDRQPLAALGDARRVAHGRKVGARREGLRQSVLGRAACGSSGTSARSHPSAGGSSPIKAARYACAVRLLRLEVGHLRLGPPQRVRQLRGVDGRRRAEAHFQPGVLLVLRQRRGVLPGGGKGVPGEKGVAIGPADARAHLVAGEEGGLLRGAPGQRRAPVSLVQRPAGEEGQLERETVVRLVLVPGKLIQPQRRVLELVDGDRTNEARRLVVVVPRDGVDLPEVPGAGLRLAPCRRNGVQPGRGKAGVCGARPGSRPRTG